MKFKNWLLIIGSLFPISASAQLDNLPQVFAPLDIAHLNEYYPESHNQWFPTGINQQESARQRYLYMAPLGVRGLAHVPEYMSNAACKAITHPAFRISDGTIEVPYYEVQAVDDRGPATNLLTAGDLIVGVGGTPLKSGTQYNPEIEYYTKRNRTLFDCLGDAIDKAEGTGSITFQVMRLPEGLSASTTIPNRNIEVHRTDLVDDHQDRAIEVNVGNAAQLRLIAEDAADGNGGDHAYWLEARWVKDDGAEVHVVNNEWIDSQVGYGSLTWGDSVTYSGGTTTNSIAAHAHSEILFNVPSGVTKLRVTFRNHSTGSVVGVVKTTATAVNYGDLAQYITDVTIPVSKIGSYLAGGAEREHKLDQMIVSQAAWLLSEQRADGGWSSLGSYTTDVWDTSYIGLAMLAADEPRFDESAKKAAYYIADRGQVTDWSSPRGIALTFLCEYYLRTGDTGILPGIEVALKMVEQNLFAQGYTGHKTLYGYGTGGQNSGFSYMAMGVALASRTPVEVDQNLLNKMMELMDAMAVNGVIGYGRLTTEGYNADQGVVDGVAMTGPCVAANSITGTSQRFHDRAKSAFAKSVGALDFGHSTQSFGLFGGTIGAINLGDEIYQGHRDRIMPKMILQRLYSGGVVTSECRLEMMGAEYMFRHRMATAIQILTLTAGRKNLAITGKAALQASTMKSGRNTHVWDMATHRFYLRGWAVAITLLGDQAPARLRSGYEALKNVSYDGALNSLHNDIYTILEANALNAVSDINALTGVSDEIKAQAIEMLLGVDLHIQVTEKASDLADVSLSAYWPLRERNRWSDSATQEAWKTNASYIMSGNISIAKGSSISADVNMAFNSSTASTNWTDGHASSLGSAEVTRLNTATEFNLPVQITYSIGGNAISYTRNVTFETALGGGHDDARHVTIPSCRVLRKTKGDELVVELNETGEYLQMHGPLATEFHQGETVQVEFKQMELSLGGHRAATKVADGLTRYRAVSFTGSPDCLVTQPDINSLVDTDLSTGGVSRALSGQIWAGFEMDLGEIKHFNGIQINKPSGGFQVFKVEAELNGEWVRILEKGWVTGTDYFDTINAQKLRVYWKANGSGYTPTINDIQVFFNPYSDKETKVALSPNGGVFTQWKLWREKYTNLSTGSIAALKANTNFPNSPSSSGPLLALETGDDVDDNYGQRWTGWITPDETGNYIFYAAADDEVELHLSTDEHPNNKVLIASKYGWTPARNWSTGAISSQISLVAGKRYYIELLHTQAYGGDNCAIAWRKPSDTAAPANGSIGITDSYFETVVGGVSATANYVFPSITSQPSAVVATAGQPASLTVVAGGSGTLTYQWMKDGVVLTNGVSSTYSIASAAAGDLGSYTCLIRNEYGQVLTQAALLSFTNSSPQAVDATFVQAENVAAGAVVGSVNATDPDSGTSFSYAITAGNTNGAFSISSTGQITTAASLDFEYIDKYVLAVQAYALN